VKLLPLLLLLLLLLLFAPWTRNSLRFHVHHAVRNSAVCRETDERAATALARFAAAVGLVMSVAYSVLPVFPIIEVADWRVFSGKIIAVLGGANAIGICIYLIDIQRVRMTADGAG
jgi:hypothetical protein